MPTPNSKSLLRSAALRLGGYLPEITALAIGVLLAVFANDASAWLLSLVDLRAALQGKELPAPRTFEGLTLRVLVLVGLAVGLLTLLLPLSRARAVALVAGPFFVAGLVGLVSVVALIGWSAKPLGGSNLVLWLYPLSVPVGVMLSRAVLRRRQSAA